MTNLTQEEYERQEYLEKLKKKKISNFNVTFDEKGNLSIFSLSDHYANTYYKHFSQKPNEIFPDILEFKELTLKQVAFRSVKTGYIYHMFAKDFNDLMTFFKMGANNQVAGKFTFCRHGTKQGVRLVFE